MASKILKYTKEDGGTLGIAVDDTLYEALNSAGTPFNDITGRMYADMAALSGDVPAAVAAPQGFQPRRIRVKHLMGTATLIVPTPFNFATIGGVENPGLLDGNALDINGVFGEQDENPAIAYVL